MDHGMAFRFGVSGKLRDLVRRVLKRRHGRHMQAFRVVRRRLITTANGLPRRLVKVQVHAKVSRCRLL